MTVARLQLSGRTDEVTFNRTHVADEVRRLVRDGTELTVEELVLDDQSTHPATEYDALVVVTRWPDLANEPVPLEAARSALVTALETGTSSLGLVDLEALVPLMRLLGVPTGRLGEPPTTEA